MIHDLKQSVCSLGESHAMSETPVIHRPSDSVFGRQPVRGRVGLFSIGLAAYWPQFPGLKERLEGYGRQVEARVGDWADVVSAGLVDDAEAARRAGEVFAREGVDLILLHTATYATSSQVLPAVQRAGVPVVVLNLQPVASLDYPNTDTGEWLANCSACCAPELAGAFARARVPYQVLSGLLDGADDSRAWREIGAWCRAAGAVRALRGARFGFLGHTYPGMLDLYSDFTQLHAQLGMHVEVLEMDDLQACVEAVTDPELTLVLTEARDAFELDPSVDEQRLRMGAHVAAGMDRLVSAHRLNALTYYYRGHGAFEALGASLILGGSRLTARGVPCAGEGDLKNAVAMFIMDRLGAGGSYTEFYAMDLNEGFMLMGHDGPGHLAISDRRPILRGLGLFHGKAGDGVSVEFKVKTGPVTILGVTQTADGRLKLLIAEGQSLPGEILRIGNTNSRLRFALPPDEFLDRWCQEGPTHHVALGVGHHARTLEKVGRLLGLDVVVVR
ncbi:MAG: putative L-arabinose isomerase protein [Chloroflexi bacterium]|nr:putative L-arabinose isomerase protein [Chloroflexota bacterium]